MTNLDAILTAAAAVSHAHTTGDLLINAGLEYGPGVLLTGGLVVAWRTWQRAVDWRHDRADRRHYTAVAFRLNRVADQADALLAMPRDLVDAQLEAQLPTDTDHAEEDR